MLKMTGRIGVILFAFILVTGLIVFTGCSREADLSGANIKVASWWSTYNVDTYEPRSESEEQELEWRRRVLAQYGFNFQVAELSDYDNYLPLVASNIMAGNREWSIYEVAPVMAITLYKQGLLYPVSDSRSVNFGNREPEARVRPMYNGLVQDFMTFNGKQYGWQYGLPNNSWGQAMLFFNTRHLVEVGLSPDYIYDLQRDNNWTWDTFLDLCRRLTRDTTGNGITDIFAIPVDDAREILRGFIYGNGANFVTFDAQGRAHNATNSPAFLEALQFFNTLINEGLVATQETYDWGWNWSAFQDERVAMTFDPEWRKGQANFEGGYVLPPRGPRSNTLRMDASDNVYVIPAFFSPEEVDVILKAAELWFTPVDTDWLQGHYWASSNLRDVHETVMMSRDARFLTVRDFFLVPGFPFDDFIAEFRNGLGRANPAQVIEAWTPRFNAAIDDFNR
jgi:ABC-type glycerol-3-phosphate transport system substrate-binding protein